MSRAPRLVALLLAAAAVIVLLFTVVFPRLEERLIGDPVLHGRAALSGDPAGDGG